MALPDSTLHSDLQSSHAIPDITLSDSPYIPTPNQSNGVISPNPNNPIVLLARPQQDRHVASSGNSQQLHLAASLPRPLSAPSTMPSSSSNQQESVSGPDQSIVEALKSSKDRLYVLKLGETMEALIMERTPYAKAELRPASSYQRLLIHRCANYYNLIQDANQYTITVIVTSESRIPPKRISELVPSEESPLPAFQIMRRTNETRSKESSRATSTDGNLTDEDPGSAQTNDSSSQGNGREKKYMTMEEREAAYNEARSRIFSGFEESSANGSTTGNGTSTGPGTETSSMDGDIDETHSTAPTESDHSSAAAAKPRDDWSDYKRYPAINRDLSNMKANPNPTSSLRPGAASFNMSGAPNGSSSGPRPPHFGMPTLYDPSTTPSSASTAHSQYGPQPMYNNGGYFVSYYPPYYYQLQSGAPTPTGQEPPMQPSYPSQSAFHPPGSYMWPIPPPGHGPPPPPPPPAQSHPPNTNPGTQNQPPNTHPPMGQPYGPQPGPPHYGHQGPPGGYGPYYGPAQQPGGQPNVPIQHPNAPRQGGMAPNQGPEGNPWPSHPSQHPGPSHVRPSQSQHWPHPGQPDPHPKPPHTVAHPPPHPPLIRNVGASYSFGPGIGIHPSGPGSPPNGPSRDLSQSHRLGHRSNSSSTSSLAGVLKVPEGMGIRVMPTINGVIPGITGGGPFKSGYSSGSSSAGSRPGRKRERTDSGATSGSTSTRADETSSIASSSSSSSKRTYTSTTSSQHHPLPERPDWVMQQRGSSGQGSSNLSSSTTGGSHHRHHPRLNGMHPGSTQIGRGSGLHSKDFPPLGKPPGFQPAPGGVWGMMGTQPKAPLYRTHSSGGGPQGITASRLDEHDRTFERPPPKAPKELFNPDVARSSKFSSPGDGKNQPVAPIDHTFSQSTSQIEGGSRDRDRERGDSKANTTISEKKHDEIGHAVDQVVRKMEALALPQNQNSMSTMSS